MEPQVRITQHYEESDLDEKSPQPPPRYKRKVKLRGIANLNLESLSNGGFVHQNDILFKTDSISNMNEYSEDLEGKISSSRE